MSAPAEITITRVYAAPREAVWQAWTDPRQIAAWWGKRGWRTPPESVTLDVRPGGAFRLTSISDADGSEMRHDGVYREVVEPERLVFTISDQPGEAAYELVTVVLVDAGDGRTQMRFEQRGHMRPEQYDRTKQGWGKFFDRIDERLAG